MTIAYSYVRFSTPEQAKGESLRRQLENARKFAAEHDLTLDETLRDEGISAFRGKNKDKGSLGSFLKKVENGSIPAGSHLIVESLDRLSREEVHIALRLFLSLIENGIILVSLSDDKIYSDVSIAKDPSELIFSIILMMRSHEESVIKSKRVKDAWQKKIVRATTDKIAMTKICPAWLRKSGPSYDVIPERAKIVQEVFDWAIEGLGTRSIAARLNQMGVETWSNKKNKGSIWYDSYIKKILENPAVYGEYTPKSKRAGGADETASETIDGYFPVVVDRETFFKVRAIISARTTSNVRAPAGKHRSILSGLAICDSCGGGMNYINKGTKGGRPYLQCHNSLLKGGCEHKQKYRYDVFQGHAILSTGSELGFEEDKFASLNSTLSEELADVEGRFEKLIDAIERAGLNDILERRLRQLEQERKRLKSELDRNQIQSQKSSFAARIRQGRTEAAVMARQLEQQPDNIDLRIRAANLLRAMFKEIRFSANELTYVRIDGGGFSQRPVPTDIDVQQDIARRLGDAAPSRPTTKIKIPASFFTEEEIQAVNDDS